MLDKQPQDMPGAGVVMPGIYTHGYNRKVVQAMSERTAEREGQFFLRHLRPGLRVLDVGCGAGSITVGFARAVAPGEVVGIDREPSVVSQAGALATERGIANAHFEVGTAEELPFPDARFDAAFASTLLEHVVDPGRVVAEMRRVLKPGGLIGLRDADVGAALTFPPNPIVEECDALYDRLWRHNGGNPQQGRQLPGLLRAAGFRDVSITAGGSILTGSVIDVWAEHVAGPRFADRVIELGWADRDTIERYVAAIREWAQDPDAFSGEVNIEALGWKE